MPNMRHGEALPAVVPAYFRPSARTILRENASVVTSHGSRRNRQECWDSDIDADGLPTMLIPGFLTGDWSMSTMARTLKHWNFAPARSGIRLNVDCTFSLLDGLEHRLDVLTSRYGRPVSLVGWSRGGFLGKMLAIRNPDMVSGLVTLVSPNANPLAISSVAAKQIDLLTKMHAFGMTGVMSQSCITGECAERVLDEMQRPFPDTVPYLGIWTRADGVVDWRACLDPDAKLLEVDSTHLGIGNEPRILSIVAQQLIAMDQTGTTAPIVESVIPTQRS